MRKERIIFMTITLLLVVKVALSRDAVEVEALNAIFKPALRWATRDRPDTCIPSLIALRIVFLTCTLFAHQKCNFLQM